MQKIDQVEQPSSVEHFSPELVHVACGVDANATDPLGRIMRYSDTYREMERVLLASANQCCQGTGTLPNWEDSDSMSDMLN